MVQNPLPRMNQQPSQPVDEFQEYENDDDVGDPNDIPKNWDKLTEEQRNKYSLFKSDDCRPPPKKVKEIIQKILPESYSITKDAAFFAAMAGKLFLADLVETARRLSNNTDPLTPIHISLAFNVLETNGKIPGKAEGRRL